MSSIPKSAPRELAPEGTHPAACVQVLDLGTQPSEQWGDRRKVQLGFELINEKNSEGAAMVVYKQYTFSSSPKSSLMKDLKGWLGKDAVGDDFEMDNLLSKGVLITVEHNETDRGTFANVTNLTALPKGTKAKQPTEPLRSLYLDESFDAEAFDKLPDFLKEKIMVTPEFEEFGAAAVAKRKPTTKKAAATPAKKVAAKGKR